MQSACIEVGFKDREGSVRGLFGDCLEGILGLCADLVPIFSF